MDDGERIRNFHSVLVRTVVRLMRAQRRIATAMALEPTRKGHRVVVNQVSLCCVRCALRPNPFASRGRPTGYALQPPLTLNVRQNKGPWGALFGQNTFTSTNPEFAIRPALSLKFAANIPRTMRADSLKPFKRHSLKGSRFRSPIAVFGSSCMSRTGSSARPNGHDQNSTRSSPSRRSRDAPSTQNAIPTERLSNASLRWASRPTT